MYWLPSTYNNYIILNNWNKISVVTVPEIEFGQAGRIKITVTSTEAVTDDDRDRYMISWTDYEDQSVDSRNDYQIIHTPNEGLTDNEILTGVR